MRAHRAALRLAPLLALFILGPSVPAVVAASPSGVGEDRPHPHNGVLQPYVGTPPAVALDDRERSRLVQGEPVYKRLKTAEGDRGVAVFRVAAPAEVVWSVIVDFASYPLWIDKVAETEVYEIRGEEIFVRFRLEHGAPRRQALTRGLNPARAH